MNRVFEGLPRALEARGLRVRKLRGWKNRGRPYVFSPHAVVFHHTASAKSRGNAPALGTVTYGRSDLPGPLCQILIARDGTVYFVAAGYANHAGEGGPWYDIPRDSGNKYAIGIEVENDGIGEEWPPPQLGSVAIVGAILLKRMGKGARYLFGHKEWTSRKIDPAGVSMGHFRKRVRRLIHS